MAETTLFTFNPSNYDELIKLMDDYGDFDGMFFGKNQDGENVTYSISKDVIKTSTLQNNGWTRVNVYYRDETEEEYYEKN